MAQPYSGDVLPGTSDENVGPKPYAGPIMPAAAYQGPVQPNQSALAKAPPQAPQQQPQVSPTIIDAINRPADRTVELMQQDTQQTLDSIQAMVKHPGVKTATEAALHVMGLPFSPITSVVNAFVGDPLVNLAHEMGASPKVDPYIRAAAQTILPVAATRSAVLKAALGTEGQFLAGGLDISTPPLKPGQSAAVISQKLIDHDQRSIAADVQLRRHVESFIDDNPQYKQHDEAIYNAIEGKSTNSLSAGARAAYNTFIKPIQRRNQLYVDELKKLGVKMPELVDPNAYIHRQAIEKPEEKGLIGQMANVVDPTGTLTNLAPTKGFGTKPSVLQTPNAGVAESTITGERGGYTIDPETNDVKIWKDGKVVDKGEIKDTPYGKQVITKNGGRWSMERGTTLEVETHTPVRYQKSAIASMTEAQRQLRDAVANARFMQGLKTSPEFQMLARPDTAATPKGWDYVKIPGYHGLDGFKFDPRLKEVIDDYTGTGVNGNTLLQGINRIVQGSIFLNPMGHILNVKMHGLLEAGLFGGVARTIEGGKRLITPEEQTLTRRAIEAVLTKNSDYVRYVAASPGLKGANNYIRNFGNDLLKEMGKNPQQLTGIAQTLGYANPALYLRTVYGASNKTLWGVGDYILMKSFLAREAEHGGTAGQVAEAVHAHIPDYVVPSRVLGTRSVAQLLKSPFALGFSRYEYNRLESYGNLIKGAIKPLPGQSRGEGMDQIAALIFHAAVTYPMIDYALQKATGNPNAQFRGFGPFLFTENLNAYGKGEKTFNQAFVQPIARPSAAVETGMELYQNRDWTGKPIYGHGGDFAKYVASKTYVTQALYRVANPPKGVNHKQAARQFILDQFGIKDPTPQQEAIVRKYAQQELKKRREDKR